MIGTIAVLDRNKNLIGFLSNNGANPIAPFFDDNYIPELSNGAETYEFSTISNAITSEMLQVGNYIVFIYDGKYKMFQIMDTEEEHEEGSILINCYCEIAGLELLTDYCEPFSIEGNVELFFNTVLQDTNWQLGGYSESLITNIQQVKVDKYTNVYKVIQENIATFGNIEIEYRVEFDGNRVLGYFIDVYANGERGNKTYKRFEYGENVKGITRKRNLYDFASAMIGVGKDNLTFKDIEWKKSKGDPADKPLAQDFIVDLEANEKFNKHGKYIKGLYENNDITNPQDLLLKTWEKLQEVKEPKFDYEVNLALTGIEYEDIKVGDTVYVIDNDYNPPIWVEARVGKPELSLSDGTAHKCTLSNYKEIVSKIKEPQDGKTPEIGDNGNWVIGGIDTGKPSQGLPGSDGIPGPPGADGDSPYQLVLNAQSFMKYIDKNTPPIPVSIPVTAHVYEGTNDITNNCSFRWYYITSNYPDLATYDAVEDTIVTLDGTDISVYDSVTTEWIEIAGVTGNTLEIAYNSDIFFEKDIINIKVVATNNGDNISTEHTIYKVYDNKYITQQEIFDKLMENGNNFVYQDETTGLIYINASYIKTGQFVADLIKGGILTLGGTGDNSLGDYGYMRVLNYDGTEEVAHLDGGDLWIKSLSVESINAKEVNAETVNNASLPSKLDENINVYVNADTGNDDVEFEEGVIYQSLQSAIDAIPDILNGKEVRIYLQTDVYEDIEYRGLSGGGIYIFLCSHIVYGTINDKIANARIGWYGGETTAKPTVNGAIKPSSFLKRNSKEFSVVTQSSKCTIFRYVDIYGATSSTDTDYYYALYCYDGANTIFEGGKIIGCDNAFRAETLGKLQVFESYGYVNNYAFRAVNGGTIGVASKTQCNGSIKVSQDATSSINYSSSGIKWDGSTTSGSNDNTTVSSKSVTFKSNYGDTYRSSIYNSWKKDNTVRQGDYGYGDCNGCWFFGSQFANLKEKTITKVVLKIKRNSGGSGASVNHVIKMHNHSSRPSGKPTYVSGWSKSVSIAAGETKTITITDSTVLSAIKSGTMKGFGIQSSYTKENYTVCSGNITVVVNYK